jgi:hypothetical protein
LPKSGCEPTGEEIKRTSRRGVRSEEDGGAVVEAGGQYIDSRNGRPAGQNVSKGNPVGFKYGVKRVPSFPGDVEP